MSPIFPPYSQRNLASATRLKQPFVTISRKQGSLRQATETQARGREEYLSCCWSFYYLFFLLHLLLVLTFDSSLEIGFVLLVEILADSGASVCLSAAT